MLMLTLMSDAMLDLRQGREIPPSMTQKKKGEGIKKGRVYSEKTNKYGAKLCASHSIASLNVKKRAGEESKKNRAVKKREK